MIRNMSYFITLEWSDLSLLDILAVLQPSLQGLQLLCIPDGVPAQQKGIKKSLGSATITSRANLWHQEEEERDTNQHAQNKRTHEKLTDQLSLPKSRQSQSWKDWKDTRTKHKERFKPPLQIVLL